jgi:hypothetical protein
LGWAHFGPNEEANGAAVGADLFNTMAANTGGGFTPPLTGTSYTFWVQDNSSDANYRFDFVVAPEPATSSFAAITLAIALGWIRRRR